MLTEAVEKKKRNWIWPVAFVVALVLVLFVSSLQDPKSATGVPVLKTPDDYNEVLNKANPMFAAALQKEGSPLSADDVKKLKETGLLFDELNLYNPTKIGPFFASGRIHLMLGENQVAAEMFQQAINNAMQPTTDPADKVTQIRADSEFYLATCSENENDFVDALPPIDAAIKTFPKRPDYLYVRARALIQLKRTAEAKKDLEAALKLKPDDSKSESLLRFLTAK